MPTASLLLEPVLTRWFDRGSELIKESSKALDQLADFRQGVDDAWADYQNHHNRDLKELEESERANDARWSERLRRLQDWQGSLARLQRMWSDQDSTASGLQWFDNAERLAPSLARRLHNRAAALEERTEVLRTRIEEWIAVLVQRETEVREFKEKAGQQPGPLLVSRARKQPDITFVEEQSIVESDLGVAVSSQRRAMNHFLGRLYKAGQFLESRARSNPVLFEVRKNQILNDLKESYKQFFAIREKVLTEALRYEACRQKLRWIKDTVNRMRCIEDIYKQPEPVWKRWLRR